MQSSTSFEWYLYILHKINYSTFLNILQCYSLLRAFNCSLIFCAGSLWTRLCTSKWLVDILTSLRMIFGNRAMLIIAPEVKLDLQQCSNFKVFLNSWANTWINRVLLIITSIICNIINYCSSFQVESTSSKVGVCWNS